VSAPTGGAYSIHEIDACSRSVAGVVVRRFDQSSVVTFPPFQPFLLAAIRRSSPPALPPLRPSALSSVERSVKRQATREVGQLLAKDHPAAVQARLEGLIFSRSIALASSVDIPWISRSMTGAR
jgi:hypothetical protein